MAAVRSVLIEGDGAGVGQALPAAAEGASCVVLLALGVDLELLAAAGRTVTAPVYIVDTYGIVGFDEGAGRNVEFLEAGRGQEYGGVGGLSLEGGVLPKNRWFGVGRLSLSCR